MSAKRINVTIEDFLLYELDYMAKKRGISRSALLAMLVSDQYIDDLRNGRIQEDFFTDQALSAIEAVPYQ